MVVRIPVIGSLFQGYIALLVFTHDCLMTKDQIIKATCIDARHVNMQQLVNLVLVPSRQNGGDMLQSMSAHCKQGETQSIKPLQELLGLVEGCEMWRGGYACMFSSERPVATFKVAKIVIVQHLHIFWQSPFLTQILSLP